MEKGLEKAFTFQYDTNLIYYFENGMTRPKVFTFQYDTNLMKKLEKRKTQEQNLHSNMILI